MTSSLCLVAPEELTGNQARLGWPEAVGIISLDRVRPFLADLDLPESDVTRSYTALREFVLRHDAWMNQDDDSPVEPELARNLSDMLAEIMRDAGERAVASIRAYVDSYLRFESVPTWQEQWRRLTWRLAHRYEAESFARSYSLPIDTTERLFRLVTAWASAETTVEERIDLARDSQLVGWDATFYALYRRETAEADPLLSLKFYLEKRLFDRTWWTLVEGLAPNEVDSLTQWGQIECRTQLGEVPQVVDLLASARQRS
jgi:hypothetical protein